MSNRIVIVRLTEAELGVVRDHARRAEIGGKSQVRADMRASTLSEDQLTAQAGEAALSKFLTGSIAAYHQTRLVREREPSRGDNGCDLLDIPIDVKTSRMRAGYQLYHLWVRPREYHPNTIYILALMPLQRDDVVQMIGWMQGCDLPFAEDKYELRQDLLYPLTDCPPWVGMVNQISRREEPHETRP